ncbi:MAG: IclR family transcriptional regulator [Kiritimatiellae bacterium]|nr:IclR family transcriptional regulator [Kiritimatiellia bacterium]
MRVIHSLVRGIRVLERIAEARDGARVADLARHFSMPSSNMTLFINSLVQAGYAIRDPATGRYHLSGRIRELAGAVRADPCADLATVAAAELDALHAQFNENVLLAVLSSYRLRFIAHRQSTRNIQILNLDEKTFIPHVTAAGKAILAFLPDPKLAKYFDQTKLERFTRKTRTQKKAILADLRRVRARGYAVNTGEYEEDIMAVAAPILARGQVVASLVVQFPVFRYGEKALNQHGPVVKTAADRVTRGLAAIGEG